MFGNEGPTFFIEWVHTEKDEGFPGVQTECPLPFQAVELETSPDHLRCLAPL